jgi:hypothetical protein
MPYSRSHDSPLSAIREGGLLRDVQNDDTGVVVLIHL